MFYGTFLLLGIKLSEWQMAEWGGIVSCLPKLNKCDRVQTSDAVAHKHTRLICSDHRSRQQPARLLLCLRSAHCTASTGPFKGRLIQSPEETKQRADVAVIQLGYVCKLQRCKKSGSDYNTGDLVE